MKEILFKTQSATKEEIYEYLKKNSKNFRPPLSTRVCISEYSKKIFLKAVTFEAWVDEKLIGFCAAYFNDFDNQAGFITTLSVDKHFQQKGIATELLKQCIGYGEDLGFKLIRLETNYKNVVPIRLYQKFNFKIYGKKGSSVFLKKNK